MPPPKTRPFRLLVHVLPPEASKKLSIQPEERFLLLSSRGTTIRDLCPNIATFVLNNYGRYASALTDSHSHLYKQRTDESIGILTLRSVRPQMELTLVLTTLLKMSSTTRKLYGLFNHMRYHRCEILYLQLLVCAQVLTLKEPEARAYGLVQLVD